MTARVARLGLAPRALRPAITSQAPTPSVEHGRRTVVRLVFVVYGLLFLEGSIRKWLLPQYGQYIYFVRDPFLLWAYVVATQQGLWPRRSPWFAIVVGMGALGLLLIAVQIALGGVTDTRLLLAFQGYRSYFLYIPLAFLVGAQFRASDLKRLYRLTLWLAIPIAVLVVLQFVSAPNAPINVGIASDEEYQFHGLTQTVEHTRPLGPFSSGAAQQQFVATAFAIVLALFIAPAAMRPMRLLSLAAAGAAVLVCTGLSGSRGTVLECAMSVVFGLLVGLLGRGGALKSRALLWTAALTTSALLLYPIVLPEGYASLMSRWTAADKVESRAFSLGVAGRALYGLVDFTRLIETVPAFGYGLGYGSNASITLGAEVDGIKPGLLAETDFSRHMVDLGPAFGLAFIGFRLAITLWLAAMALRITRQVADPMPLLLLSYVAVTVSSGQVTGQGAITCYAWLFAGVLIAACRHAGADARPGRVDAPISSVRAPRRAHPRLQA